MLESLMQFFGKSKEETKGKTPEGLCPNCWGEQEYDKVIREMHYDKQIDVNNHTAQHTIIQKFVVNKVEGIKLEKTIEGYVCPTCRIKH